jgi:hypothetical protein
LHFRVRVVVDQVVSIGSDLVGRFLEYGKPLSSQVWVVLAHR